MGDLRVGAGRPNVLVTGGHHHSCPLPSPSSSSSSSSSSLASSPNDNPHPLSIAKECWARAEKSSREIVRLIQPTILSEQRRQAVIEYVQRLVTTSVGGEVFAFGSVPLKTYLPDGDIDLTFIGSSISEEVLTRDVRAALEREAQSSIAEFEVKDIQYIHAEVKLVKCLVQNILVDISFNQVGGLSALCFLERVDDFVGKDHLFKWSIILIKAWCYYESRILGAYHGLISTYALEILVLYIFNLFHSSLSGPVAVLYRFLDYYSKFDWDNYCININGPVRISSLPELVAETPENDGDDLLLSGEFLRTCKTFFSVPQRRHDSAPRSFPTKYLNIVDPLRESNNLGRSVSKGNFYRIRSAFSYGARKLGRILSLPEEKIADELKKFFMNTLDRHGNGFRADLQDYVPTFSHNYSILASLPTDVLGWSVKGLSREEANNNCNSEAEKITGIRFGNEPRRPSPSQPSSYQLLKTGNLTNQNGVSGMHLSCDAVDNATSKMQSLKITAESPSSAMNVSSVGRRDHASLSFPNMTSEIRGFGNKNADQQVISNSGGPEGDVLNEMSGVAVPMDTQNPEFVATNNDYFWTYPERRLITFGSAYGFLPFGPITYSIGDINSIGDPQILNFSLDLRGEYRFHFQRLVYALWCQQSAYSPTQEGSPPSRPHPQNRHSRDSSRQSLPVNGNLNTSTNESFTGSQFHFAQHSEFHPPAFGCEEMPRSRGIGTYFPNMGHQLPNDRASGGNGMNSTTSMHGQFPRPLSDSDRLSRDRKLPRDSRKEPLVPELPDSPGFGKAGHFELLKRGCSPTKGVSPVNDSSSPPEKPELRHFLPGPSSPVVNEKPESSIEKGSTTTSWFQSLVAMKKSKETEDVKPESVPAQSYHLKDDKDFPPLTARAR